MPSSSKSRGGKRASPAEFVSVGSRGGHSHGRVSKSTRRKQTQRELSYRIANADPSCTGEKLLRMIARLRKSPNYK